MKIRVVFTTSSLQLQYELSLPPGSVVEDAVRASGLLAHYPGLLQEPLGIYGRPVNKNTLLAEGDRVEFYRQLVREPKEARRSRSRLRPQG
jgi:putative ubiquitin-RnfH superfamily antitoxin RatB of RatAB toxin-antitoxin module